MGDAATFSSNSSVHFHVSEGLWKELKPALLFGQRGARVGKEVFIHPSCLPGCESKKLDPVLRVKSYQKAVMKKKS